MSKFLENLLSKPIEHLKITRKIPPNKEALKLYREVLKFSYNFYWNNLKGDNWGEMIRKSARKEFDLSKDEQDPLMALKMIMTTRESIIQARDKMNEALFQMQKTINDNRNN